MTTRYKTKAFVFKKSDKNEADRIFSVFTEDFGRLDIFAKSIRKIPSKLRGGMDIFGLSEIEFIQGKNKKTLTDAVSVENFSGLQKNIWKFSIANKISRILDDFINGEQEDRDIFSLLVWVIRTLDSADCVGGNIGRFQFLIFYYFLWNMLFSLGYLPEVEKCTACRQKLDPSDIFFSYKLGGSVCKECLDHNKSAQKINSDIIKVLRLFFKKDWDTVSKLRIDSTSQKLFQKISKSYYDYILSSHSSKNVLKVRQ